MKTWREPNPDHPRGRHGKFVRKGEVDSFVQRLSDEIGTAVGASVGDYRISHQPPDPDYGAKMNDPEMMMPDFVAHPEYYRTGDPVVDGESTRAILRAVHGGPDTMVWIYRAAPKGVPINPDDWVTPSKTYAKQHGIDEIERGEWEIHARRVRAGDLYTEGNSIAEWGWSPR